MLAKLGPRGIGGPHDRGLLGQKVRKKVFNWSEVHLYRSNFLQNLLTVTKHRGLIKVDAGNFYEILYIFDRCFYLDMHIYFVSDYTYRDVGRGKVSVGHVVIWFGLNRVN